MDIVTYDCCISRVTFIDILENDIDLFEFLIRQKFHQDLTSNNKLILFVAHYFKI